MRVLVKHEAELCDASGFVNCKRLLRCLTYTTVRYDDSHSFTFIFMSMRST